MNPKIEIEVFGQAEQMMNMAMVFCVPETKWDVM